MDDRYEKLLSNYNVLLQNYTQLQDNYQLREEVLDLKQAEADRYRQELIEIKKQMATWMRTYDAVQTENEMLKAELARQETELDSVWLSFKKSQGTEA